jgi:hypothetical protein
MNSTSIEALESQAFALMGRLHVQLRREIGRVTDIKYMSTNAEYCLHVLELASSTANTDLQTMCHKLEEIYFGEGGLFADSAHKPRRLTVASSSRVSIPIEHAAPENVEPSEAEPDVESDQHYVGRLR